MILNKLSSIPAVLRLSLCLLVSAGVHGGVIYYPWANRPSPLHEGRSAVAVALVSTADTSSLAVAVPPGTPAVHSTVNERAQDIAPGSPAQSPMSVAKSLAAITTMPGMAGTTAESAEESAEDVGSTGPVCVEPRQRPSEPFDEVASPTGYGTAPSQSGIATASMPGAEGAQRDDGPATDSENDDSKKAPSTGESLIEAMPNYLNNPLPEYPSVARQRHWEGVVWLLVDVSAKGLVDGVELEHSCGYRVLDRAASKAVKHWEFAPATRAGLPVESQVRIPVRFSLEDS